MNVPFPTEALPWTTRCARMTRCAVLDEAFTVFTASSAEDARGLLQRQPVK